MGGSGLSQASGQGSGGQGDRAAIVADASNPGLAGQQAMASSALDTNVQNLLSGVGSGKISLQDALSQAGSMTGTNPYDQKRAQLQQQMMDVGNSGGDQKERDQKLALLQNQLNQLPSDAQYQSAMQQQAINSLYTDPRTGSMLASNAVRTDPLTSGLFGQGGMQDQAQSRYGVLNNQYDTTVGNLAQDRQALSGNDPSYGLNAQDLAAYGQASGNIGRSFGAQSQNLAQMLASRGLDASASGVAGQSFSNLYGNQAEQLAGLQQQIAQNRIQTAQNLAQARTQADLQQQATGNQAIGANNNLIQGLGSLGQEALQNQYGRQLSGAEYGNNVQNAAAGAGMTNQAAQQNVANSQFSQAQSTAAPSAGQILGSIAGAGLGAATGGLGSSIGSALGSKIGKAITG